MSVLINADTSDGLVLTSDTSGEIKLQSAGADIATVDSTGITMAAGKTLPAASLTGTLPAIDGSSLTNLPAPTTAQVLTANAGLTYGDVGTYALLANESGTSQLTPGSTLAGSSLSAANTYASGTSSGRSNYVPSGTWRICGQTGYFNDTLTATAADLRISLWVRIS